MSLVILLSSSSFLFTPYFESFIQHATPTKELTTFAADKNLTAAHYFYLSSEDKGSTRWLKSSYELAKTDGNVAYNLGHFFLENENILEAEKNWLHAISLGDDSAITSLAHLYYQQQKHLEVQNLLQQKVSALSTEETLLQLKAAIALGQIDQFSTLINTLKQSNHHHQFIQELAHYGIGYGIEYDINSGIRKPQQAEEIKLDSCPLSITLTAGNITDLRKWRQIEKQYKHHPLSDYICIDEVRYFPVVNMQCELDKDMPIQCDEGFWQQYASQISSQYLAVMQPVGGANVHYGVLYLDRADSAAVFAHEVAHLLGFADEYQLSETHQLCQQTGFDKSHNIALIDESYLTNKNEITVDVVRRLPWSSLIPEHYLINRKTIKLNQEITEEGVGVFAAETCRASNNVLALKPVNKLTTLRNYNIDFSSYYLALLAEDKGYEKFAMPSFHYNIAYHLFLEGEEQQAKRWLALSADFFNLPSTKQKVLTGSY